MKKSRGALYDDFTCLTPKNGNTDKPVQCRVRCDVDQAELLVNGHRSPTNLVLAVAVRLCSPRSKTTGTAKERHV